MDSTREDARVTALSVLDAAVEAFKHGLTADPAWTATASAAAAAMFTRIRAEAVTEDQRPAPVRSRLNFTAELGGPR